MMRNEILGVLLTKLGTMEGKYWPVLRDDGDERDDGDVLDPDRASYAEVLKPLSDAVGALMAPRLLTAFQQRPSHRALRDWAVSLIPEPVFDIRQLDAPRAARPRLTGPSETAGGVMLGCLPREARAKIIERLRQLPSSAEGVQEWGLQFRDRATGRIQRTPAATYSRAAAERKAAARNEKWPHQETTVYRRGEPMPNQPAVTLADAPPSEASRADRELVAT